MSSPDRSLLVLMPSRGRARNIAQLVTQYGRSCTLDTTQIALGIDPDDPDLGAYREAAADPRWSLEVGTERMNLTQWTNHLWRRARGQFAYFGSFGDDHFPRVKGWDAALVKLIEAGGGEGFAYPNDFFRQETPSAWVVSAGICDALGWVCHPAMGHYYVDNVVRDLGLGADCIWMRPDIVVEHMHVNMEGGPKARPDETYLNAYDTFWTPDSIAYNRWRNRWPGWAEDIETVRRVRAERLRRAG